MDGKPCKIREEAAMKTGISSLTIQKGSSIATALNRMDANGRKLLIVTDNEKYFSMLSIGDIQRAILHGHDTESEISKILRKNVTVAQPEDNIDEIKRQMLKRRNEYMPIVSDSGEILRVLFWEELFENGEKIPKQAIDLPVVIMAGGIGSRLRPLTNVLPKALIPIGEKSIIEQIMDSFLDFGCKEFYLSIKHKAEMIKYYFYGLKEHYGSVHFVEEADFCGTAGSIALLKGIIKETFFVSNCDILVDQDYAEILDYHRSQKNELTIVAAMLNMRVPYGVLNTKSNGQLLSISEKPELYYKINTGLYILEPSVFESIPEGKVFHITDLIEALIGQNCKVGVFPVSENSWTDMGNWDEFLKQAKVKN